MWSHFANRLLFSFSTPTPTNRPFLSQSYRDIQSVYKETKMSREDELLTQASLWHRGDEKGIERDSQGRLKGWKEWSSTHPQKNMEINICQGREKWSELNHSVMQEQNCFSVISWNLLSDAFYEKGKDGIYSYINYNEGCWKEFRAALFLKWIDDLSADIYAFQEVDFVVFEKDLFPEMQRRGYDGKIQGVRKRVFTHPCGVATFWRVHKFELIKNKKEEASFSRSMVINLQPVDPQKSHVSDRHISIINVHLEGSQTAIGAAKRAKQLNSPLAWVSRQNDPRSSSSILICGDFNTSADASLLSVLRRHKWHGFGLCSVYEHTSVANSFPVCRATYLAPRSHYLIDHILYSYDAIILKGAFDTFSKTEVDEHIGLSNDIGFPNALCPSDHIPIGGFFKFKDREHERGTFSLGSNKVEKIQDDRKAELRQQWEGIESEKPTHFGAGKPTPEELVERQEYVQKIKEWKNNLNDNFEEDFVKGLIKGKIK